MAMIGKMESLVTIYRASTSWLTNNNAKATLQMKWPKFTKVFGFPKEETLTTQEGTEMLKTDTAKMTRAEQRLQDYDEAKIVLTGQKLQDYLEWRAKERTGELHIKTHYRTFGEAAEAIQEMCPLLEHEKLVTLKSKLGNLAKMGAFNVNDHGDIEIESLKRFVKEGSVIEVRVDYLVSERQVQRGTSKTTDDPLWIVP
jgi:hypothetical protein